MKKDYLIVYNPNKMLSGAEMMEIADCLDGIPFFVMPKPNNDEDEYIVKTVYQNEILNLDVAGFKYDVIEEVEKFNVELIEDYFRERHFKQWLKDNKVSLYKSMKTPDDEDIKRITIKIKKKKNVELVYILYPPSFGKEYLKIAFLVDETVIRIKTKWKYLRELWRELPQLHPKLEAIRALGFYDVTSLSINEEIN